ncbi:transposase [Paracoccus pantotrophus]|uniref:transposase n=1 Tax=Paracoccus pantotrophus TaxID=82367 RepID=UPI002ED7AADD
MTISVRGVIFGSRLPRYGVNFARRFTDCRAARARNKTLKATQRLGRAAWERWSGYHARSRIESKMRCLKAFGERIASRDPDRQKAEVQIRVALINRFNAIGTAEIERVS